MQRKALRRIDRLQQQLPQRGEGERGGEGEEEAGSAMEVGGSQTSLNQQVDELLAAVPPESKCKSLLCDGLVESHISIANW